MFLLLLLTLSTLLAPATSSKQNIVELALATPQLSTLVTALKAASLVDTLTGDGPFTVFAPTNTAFDALLPGVLANLLKPANKAQLSDLLTYHVVSGNIMTSMILDKEMIKTVEGKYVTARKADALTIFINSARITVSNVTASNGVIHFIDAVLVPSGAPPTPPTPPPPAPGTQNIVQLASATPDLSTLVEAVKAAALVDTLESTGPFTVFAPMNEAFAALPAGTLANLLKPKNKAQLVRLLTYHVVQGAVKAADILDGERLLTVEGMYVMCAVNKSGVFINNAQVTTADVMASNGVVHIINQVLLPRSIPPAPPVYKNIVELAIATPTLSTLVTALKAADLVDTLSGNGPFTVFAVSCCCGCSLSWLLVVPVYFVYFCVSRYFVVILSSFFFLLFLFLFLPSVNTAHQQCVRCFTRIDPRFFVETRKQGAARCTAHLPRCTRKLHV